MKTRRIGEKNGLAAVEMAFALPLVLLLTFGTLDVCDGIFLQQKAELAAHEGARIAIERDATRASVETAVENYLDARGLEYDQIDTVLSMNGDPASFELLDPVTVRVELDLEENRRLPFSFYQFVSGSSVGAEVTMYKEQF